MASGSTVTAEHARRQLQGPPSSPNESIVRRPSGSSDPPIALGPQGPLVPPTVSVPAPPIATISSSSGTIKPTATQTSTSSFPPSSSPPSSSPITSISTPSLPPTSTPSPSTSALSTFTAPSPSSDSISFTTQPSEASGTTSTSASWSTYEAANLPAADIPPPAPRQHRPHISLGLAAALGVISTLAFVILLLLILFFLRRRQRHRSALAATDFEIQNPDPRYDFNGIGAGYSSRATRASSSNWWHTPRSGTSDESRRASGASSVFPTFLPRPRTAVYSTESSSEDSLWDVLSILPRPLSPPPRYAPTLPSQLVAIARVEKVKQSQQQMAQTATPGPVRFPTLSLLERSRASVRHSRSLTARFSQPAIQSPTTPSESLSVGSVADTVTPLQRNEPNRRSVQLERARNSTDSGLVSAVGRALSSRPGTGRSGQTFGRNSRSLEGEPVVPTWRGSVEAVRPSTSTTDATHEADPTHTISPGRVRFSVDVAERRRSNDSDERS